tara:strand:+ start:554 stop:820 length:267 start_codon:yes stop_codon:yes gene_type:complete
MHFIIFGFQSCGWCKESKDLVKKRKHTSTFVKLNDFDWGQFAEAITLLKKYKWLNKNKTYNSVPVIFQTSDNKVPKYIGGYDQLSKLI